MYRNQARNHSTILSWPKFYFDCIRFIFICFIVCNFSSGLIRYIIIGNHFIHETHRLRRRISFPFQMYKEIAFNLYSSCNKVLPIVEQEKAICFMWIVCFSIAFFYITSQFSAAEYHGLFLPLLFWSAQNVLNPLSGRNSRVKSQFAFIISRSHNNGTKNRIT